MAKRTMKAGTLLAPVPPALITVRGQAGVNVMTAAWCGILCSDPPMTYVSVRPTRWTHGILSQTREFVINLPRARDAKKVDFCGIYTGAKIDKMEKCGFHAVPSIVVAAPGIEECPVQIECRVTEIRPLGTHDCFVAEILAVTADEALFDESGKLHMERADLLAYAHGGYYGLGRRLGDFGFSARKKKRNGDGQKAGAGRRSAGKYDMRLQRTASGDDLPTRAPGGDAPRSADADGGETKKTGGREKKKYGAGEKQKHGTGKKQKTGNGKAAKTGGEGAPVAGNGKDRPPKWGQPRGGSGDRRGKGKGAGR